MGTQDLIILLSNMCSVVLLDLIGPEGGWLRILVYFFIGSNEIGLSEGKFFSVLVVIYLIIGVGLALGLFAVLRNFVPTQPDFHLISYIILDPLFVVFVFILLTTFSCSDADQDNPSL